MLVTQITHGATTCPFAHPPWPEVGRSGRAGSRRTRYERCICQKELMTWVDW
jgi:hypothetical protein